MFKKILYAAMIITVSIFNESFSSGINSEFIDPDSIQCSPVKTQNDFGMNFNCLGNFEEEFLMDCLAVPDVANVLFEGEAYGRLAMRALRETTNSLANIYVNELSEDNLRHLRLKLALMGQHDLKSTQEAARVFPITGDCLQLHKNHQFLDLLQNRNPNNHFDLIMCANVIHFFDGEQVLKFFIDTFNYLKPGAKAYIFCRTRGMVSPQEQCVGNSNRMISRLATEVYNAALGDDVSIFPGLFQVSWLSESKDKESFRNKHNRIPTDNTIPEHTLSLLAQKIGYEILSKTTYESCDVSRDRKLGDRIGRDFQMMLNQTKQPYIVMLAKPMGTYCGLIIKKPENHDGGLLTEASLDQGFVRECKSASHKMEEYFKANFVLSKTYPYVIPKDKKRK